MSNCDDLLRQIAELKQRLAKETADMDNTQRVSRLLSNDQAGDPATQMLRRNCYIDNAGKYEFSLPPHFILLDPMDLITITDTTTMPQVIMATVIEVVCRE
jgi:hypothetical protein